MVNFTINENENNYYYFGDNTSYKHNAIKNESEILQVLYIPSVIDGKNIEEIGKYAFSALFSIEEVIICEGIKRINERAFSQCYSIKRVQIPASVTFLGNRAIHTFNGTKYNILPKAQEQNNEYSADSTLEIYFAHNSKISYISEGSISRAKNIVIHFWGNKSPINEKNPFFQSCSQSIKIFAPFTSKFCGYKTISCITRRIKCQRNLMSYVNVMILLVS